MVVIDSRVVVENLGVWVVDPVVGSRVGLLVVVVVWHDFWLFLGSLRGESRKKYVQWKVRGERELIDGKGKEEERKKKRREKGSACSSRLFLSVSVRVCATPLPSLFFSFSVPFSFALASIHRQDLYSPVAHVPNTTQRV